MTSFQAHWFPRVFKHAKPGILQNGDMKDVLWWFPATSWDHAHVIRSHSKSRNVTSWSSWTWEILMIKVTPRNMKVGFNQLGITLTHLACVWSSASLKSFDISPLSGDLHSRAKKHPKPTDKISSARSGAEAVTGASRAAIEELW